MLLVEHQHVNGTVNEPLVMHLLAGCLAQHLVLLVHYIEKLIILLCHLGQRMRVVGIRQAHPILQPQFLRSGGGGDAELGRNLAPGGGIRQLLVHLLAALGKAAAHQLIHEPVVIRRQALRVARREQHHRGINLRTRVEGLRRHRLERLRYPVHLNAQGEQTVGLISRLGQNAVNELLLQHHHGAGDRTGRCEKISQNGTTGRVGQVAHEFHRLLGKKRSRVPAGTVGMVHFHVGRIGPAAALVFGQAGIELHQNQLAAERSHVLGERARAGAHFHHTVAGFNLQLAHNPAGDIFVHQEVLPKRFGGAYPGFFQYLSNLRSVHVRGIVS